LEAKLLDLGTRRNRIAGQLADDALDHQLQRKIEPNAFRPRQNASKT
jgi:hypothetical protein